MENVKTKTTYIIQGNDKDYLCTLYKDSVSDGSNIDNAMKFDNLEECKVVSKLAGKHSSNFSKSRILAVETKTYFLEEEEIPEIEL